MKSEIKKFEIRDRNPVKSGDSKSGDSKSGDSTPNSGSFPLSYNPTIVL